MGMPTISNALSGFPVISKGSPVMNGNPDPLEFNITYYETHGKYWLVKVNYPNCTNFEGNKIVVMTTKAYNKALEGYFDPHFLKDNGIIARFHPEMMDEARLFCNMMVFKEKI